MYTLRSIKKLNDGWWTVAINIPTIRRSDISIEEVKWWCPQSTRKKILRKAIRHIKLRNERFGFEQPDDPLKFYKQRLTIRTAECKAGYRKG